VDGPLLRTLELLDRSCITGGVAELVGWRRRNPWRWVRVYAKWYVEMKREEGFARFGLKERGIKMIGNAKFHFDPHQERITELQFSDVVQPHTPTEHDIFEAIVRERAGRIVPVTLSVVDGALKVEFAIPVPQLEKDGETGTIMLKSEMETKRRLAREAAEKAAQDQKAADAAADAERKMHDDRVIDGIASAVGDKVVAAIAAAKPAEHKELPSEVQQ
jgi:hypothetical protein